MSTVEIVVWAVFFACALAGVVGMHVWTYLNQSSTEETP